MGVHYETAVTVVIKTKNKHDPMSVVDLIVQRLENDDPSESVSATLQHHLVPGCDDPGYGGCMPTCDYCKQKKR